MNTLLIEIIPTTIFAIFAWVTLLCYTFKLKRGDFGRCANLTIFEIWLCLLITASLAATYIELSIQIIRGL